MDQKYRDLMFEIVEDDDAAKIEAKFKNRIILAFSNYQLIKILDCLLK